MTTIPPELSQALEEAGNEPLRMVHPQTKQAYVLVKEEVFEQIRGLLSEDPDAHYPYLADLSPEDWEDRSAYPSP